MIELQKRSVNNKKAEDTYKMRNAAVWYLR